MYDGKNEKVLENFKIESVQQITEIYGLRAIIQLIMIQIVILDVKELKRALQKEK